MIRAPRLGKNLHVLVVRHEALVVDYVVFAVELFSGEDSVRAVFVGLVNGMSHGLFEILLL